MLPFIFAIPGIGPIIAGIAAVVPSFVWKIAGVALLALALIGYGEVRGKRIERAKCVAAAEQARREADFQDRKAQTQTDKIDEAVLGELRAQKEKDDVELEKLRSELSKRPPGRSCALTESDARGLRY